MNPSSLSVITSGFVALDVVIHGRERSHVAGGTANNVAANLAFLGWKASVTGIVGVDHPGRRIVNDLMRSGVDTSLLTPLRAASTPVVIHEILNDRHRFRFRCEDCGRRFPRFRPPPPSAASLIADRDESVDVFLFDRPSRYAVELASYLRTKGALVIFEPSTLGFASNFRRALEVSDVLKYSDERLSAFESELDSIQANAIQIMTNGKAGAKIRVGKRRWRRVEGFTSPSVVDAGGAGDWMTAGTLHALGTNVRDRHAVREQIDEALVFGQALAALSCMFPGARGMSTSRTRQQILSDTRRTIETGPPTRDGHLRAPRVTSRATCQLCLA